jgi:hypothetical protein
MARGIRVERLMIPRSRPINGMKTRQDGIDVCVYVPIPIPIRVRLACARDAALRSSLSQDLGRWISPRYPSYPTLSPLSEATKYEYGSRQVVKDRHRPSNLSPSKLHLQSIFIIDVLYLCQSTNHNIRMLSGVGRQLLTRMATPKLTLYVDTVSPFGESISFVLQPLKLRLITPRRSFKNPTLTLCTRICHLFVDQLTRLITSCG